MTTLEFTDEEFLIIRLAVSVLLNKIGEPDVDTGVLRSVIDKFQKVSLSIDDSKVQVIRKDQT